MTNGKTNEQLKSEWIYNIDLEDIEKKKKSKKQTKKYLFISFKFCNSFF